MSQKITEDLHLDASKFLRAPDAAVESLDCLSFYNHNGVRRLQRRASRNTAQRIMPWMIPAKRHCSRPGRCSGGGQNASIRMHHHSVTR